MQYCNNIRNSDEAVMPCAVYAYLFVGHAQKHCLMKWKKCFKKLHNLSMRYTTVRTHLLLLVENLYNIYKNNNSHFNE